MLSIQAVLSEHPMNKLLIALLIFLTTDLTAFSQSDISKIDIYWGKVSKFTVSAEQLKTINQIYVLDTILKRQISDIHKFRFIVQPIMNGPVRVAETKGNILSQQMRTFIEDPKPGDRIIFSEIFAYVTGEGVRQIPTAIVFVVE